MPRSSITEARAQVLAAESEQPATLGDVVRELRAIRRRLDESAGELIDAAAAARLAGMSKASWWRLHSAAKCPAPVKVSGKTMWKRAELVAWIKADCPDRKAWEALRGRER